MINGTLLLQTVVFAFTLWFGLYLLARDRGKPGLRFAGLGLIAYALGIGLDALGAQSADVARWRVPLVFLPALFWFGATLHLLPDTVVNRARDGGLLIVAGLVYAIGVIVDLTSTGSIYWLLGGGALLLSLGALYRVWRIYRAGLSRRPLVVMLAVTIFFVLSTALVILPQDWLSTDLVVLALGGDLIFLCLPLVVLDAYDEGEALMPDFLRSFASSFVIALIFGGQVALIMAITGDTSLPLLFLLLALITTAIVLQAFADTLQTLLDRFIFARFPRLTTERADLRAVARAAPRVDVAVDMLGVDEAKFDRLTRRALSHMGDLGRLASSPLTRLPAIDQRLVERGQSASILERAAELRALLTESIERLKPRGEEDFGTSDEWRYYNALYFPYVIGLKPYSRRDGHHLLEGETQAALDWFRTYVPERTLHNWQNAAAKLIAQELREMVGEI